MKRAILFLIASLQFSTASAQVRTVSDELVSNLRCDRLSAAQIRSAIDPAAFEWPRRIPLENHSANGIQHCWALAKFQRLSLMLGRRTGPGLLVTPKGVGEIARGYKLVRREKTRGVEQKKLRLEVFRWPVEIGSMWGLVDMNYVMAQIDEGMKPNSLQKEIERSQTKLFYRGSNLSWVFFTPPPWQQAVTLSEIFKRTKQNRLPLINLRFSPVKQHIVVGVKMESEEEHKWKLKVIDPNSPTQEAFLFIEQTKLGHFDYRLETGWDPGRVAGAVFLADEGEESGIDAALVRHYTGVCSRLGASKNASSR